LEFYLSARKYEAKNLSYAFNTLILSFSCLFLSPFLQWWQNFQDNWYFFVSAELFLLCLSIFLFNFAGLLKTSVDYMCFKHFSVLAKFARLFVLYGLMAPFLAFFVASLYGQIGGDDVYSIVLNASVWVRVLLFLPVFILCVLTDLTRYGIEKRGFEPSEKNI
jgi:hypothetical protein